MVLHNPIPLYRHRTVRRDPGFGHTRLTHVLGNRSLPARVTPQIFVLTEWWRDVQYPMDKDKTVAYCLHLRWARFLFGGWLTMGSCGKYPGHHGLHCISRHLRVHRRRASDIELREARQLEFELSL